MREGIFHPEMVQGRWAVPKAQPCQRYTQVPSERSASGREVTLGRDPWMGTVLEVFLKMLDCGWAWRVTLNSHRLRSARRALVPSRTAKGKTTMQQRTRCRQQRWSLESILTLLFSSLGTLGKPPHLSETVSSNWARNIVVAAVLHRLAKNVFKAASPMEIQWLLTNEDHDSWWFPGTETQVLWRPEAVIFSYT